MNVKRIARFYSRQRLTCRETHTNTHADTYTEVDTNQHRQTNKEIYRQIQLIKSYQISNNQIHRMSDNARGWFLNSWKRPHRHTQTNRQTDILSLVILYYDSKYRSSLNWVVWISRYINYLNEWMSQWMNECTNEWSNEWKNELIIQFYLIQASE